MNTEQLEKCIEAAIKDHSCGMISNQYMFTEHGLRAVMKALFAGKVLVPVDTADKVGAALRMAFLMGQTYWQQADSEYISQHRKAGETMEKYNQLRSETVAMLAASQESCTECGLQKGVTTGPYCVSCGRTSNG